MAVKDHQYRYFPSQERLVNVSNYMINPEHGSSSPDGWLDIKTRRQHGGYDNASDSFRRGRGKTIAGGVEASPDFEMRNVQWSEDTLTVSDLLSLRFPAIVKVVKGYYGNDEQQLVDGQILQIYMSCEELRVAATDSRERHLTLPINCPLNVRLHSGPHCSEQTQALSDLLKDVSFPASVEVTGVKHKDNPSSKHLLSSLSDSRLTLREISRQKFLVANAIRRGWLDQSRFVIIPEQLKQLTFRRATGIRHVTKEEWKDISGMYFRAARHLKFHLISGYPDVIYDDWINQSKPTIVEPPPSPRIDSDAEEDEDSDDSDSADPPQPRTRSRLLQQQAPLSQGSLPSLPTALRDSTMGSDPGPGSRASGSITPSHLSNESIQPCVSTESLLPRGSVDSGTVTVKETVSKRKSNKMPPRLLRRKAESKKLDTGGSVTVKATEFELKSNVITKTCVVPPRKSGSVPCSSSMFRSAVPVTDGVSTSLSNEDEEECDVDNDPDFVFDDPSWKDITGPSNNLDSDISVTPRSAAACHQGQRSLGNQENASSNDVTNTSLDDVKNKWRENDCGSRLHGSSDDTLLDVKSVDGDVTWSPVYWSSDLCIASASQPEKSSRMKRTKAQTRSAILSSRDLCASPNATIIDRPLSQQNNSTNHSFGHLASTQSLFSSTSTVELSSKHGIHPGVELRPDPRSASTSSTPHGSTGCIATRPDYSNPIKLGVNRSRKLSNGLVRMKLDQNGTALSIGSDVIDDGYSTKGNSMTSSVETLQARRSMNTDRESLC